ncbi:hypothetical protein EIP91_010915, partial [Steccherinum ochraceum]
MAKNKGKETRPKGPQTQNSEPVELSEEALAKKEKVREQTKLRQREFRAREKAKRLAAEAESDLASVPKRKHSNSGASEETLVLKRARSLPQVSLEFPTAGPSASDHHREEDRLATFSPPTPPPELHQSSEDVQPPR